MAVGRERGCISFSLTQRIDIRPQTTFSSSFFFFGVAVGEKTDQNEKKGVFANTGFKKNGGSVSIANRGGVMGGPGRTQGSLDGLRKIKWVN